jgi:hypothetical protein
MIATTTVIAAMEIPVEAGSAVELASVNFAMLKSACILVVVSAAISVTWAITPRTAIVCTAPIGVIPRARSDEHAAHEVIRSVVSIGSAGVGIIPIVAISTNRRGSDSDPNANSNLCIRLSCGEHQNSEQRQIF